MFFSIWLFFHKQQQEKEEAISLSPLYTSTRFADTEVLAG